MPGKSKNKATEAVYREAVIVGNGPSAISLSYMLSGHAPYYRGVSNDDFLHIRMSDCPGETLFLQDLEFLSDGLQGRSTNPVSVLFDALTHPEADMGLEQPSLLHWKFRPDLRIDHVVLGQGRPGGAWKMMSDTDLLTVSLGTWMDLPNLSMNDWRPIISEAVGSRVSVSTVAEYYDDYVKEMALDQYFNSGTHVTRVRKIRRDCDNEDLGAGKKVPDEDNAVFQQESLYEDTSVPFIDDEDDDDGLSSINAASFSFGENDEAAASIDNRIFCDFSTQRNCLSATRLGQYVRSQARRRTNTSCCPLDLGSGEKCCDQNVVERYDLSWNPIVFCRDSTLQTCHWEGSAPSFGSRSYSWGSSNFRRRIKCSAVDKCPLTSPNLWEVEGIKTVNGSEEPFRYLTTNVILATGSYDKPNLLDVPGEGLSRVVVHSLKEMESRLADKPVDKGDIMVVGAGLSAADAIIAAHGRHLSVVHVFRRDPDDRRLIFNNLPPTMYPEYHGVHKMMGSRTPSDRYTPYAQHHVVSIEENGEVTLHGLSNELVKVKVSLVVVLIGSSPNLDFLDDRGHDLGVLNGEPISRNNPVDIDLVSHESVRLPSLYAMGPLVGDNFVRFLQGGALAIASHIVKKKRKLFEL